MQMNEVSGIVVDAAIAVHRELGPGLLESAYEACLLFELHSRGLEALRQLELPIVYRGITIEVGYRLDILVDNQIIVEVKAVDELAPIHTAQVISYLKLSGKPPGLLMNFNVTKLKDGLKRLANPGLSLPLDP